jgi:hypothetical protein
MGFDVDLTRERLIPEAIAVATRFGSDFPRAP